MLASFVTHVVIKTFIKYKIKVYDCFYVCRKLSCKAAGKTEKNRQMFHILEDLTMSWRGCVVVI